MYFIITYGKPGMRGVQVRGLRIAECLPKDEVLFLNCNQGEWLHDTGYNVLDLDFLEEVVDSEYIKQEFFDKYHPKAVIFTDLPTNRIFQMAFFMAAHKYGVPLILFDNIYSTRQLQERPYQASLAYSDLTFLNGPSYLQVGLDSSIKVIPPFIYKPAPELVQDWKGKLGINAGDKVITLSAYNESTHEVVKKIVEKIPSTANVKVIIINPEIKEIHKTELFTEIPFLNTTDLAAVYELTDIMVGKMGYLQFLESFVLQKIYISVGKIVGYQTAWLDEKLKELTFHFDEYNDELTLFIQSLLEDSSKREALVQQIASLHTIGLLDKDAVRSSIEQLTIKEKDISKTVLLYVDHNAGVEELRSLKEVMKKEKFLYPLIFFKEKRHVENLRKVLEYSPREEGTVIDSFFYSLQYLSTSYFHALSQIFPWYDDSLSMLRQLLKSADKVIVFGEFTQMYFAHLLKELDQTKISKI